MADKNVRGRFVWHELITPDAAGAQAFYTKAVGWRTQPWGLDPSYTLFVTESGPLGGSVQRPSEPARWLPYIGTEHIEGTVDQARSLGARVLTDVTVMPSEGKYAVLEDPQGVVFGVYASPTDPEPAREAKSGEFSWHELATDDFRAAFEFYSALFGWEAVAEHDMGAPLGTYFTFGRGGVEIGGMFKRMPEMPQSAWLGYVRVKDIDQTLESARLAGGSVILEPMEVPGGDRVAQLNDPQGGTFAVHTFAADLKPAAAEPPSQEEEPTVETGSTEEQAAAAGAARRAAGKKAASKKSREKAVRTSVAKKGAKKKAGAGKKAGTKKKAAPKRNSAKKTAPRRAARGATKRRTGAKKRAAGGAKRSARKVARGVKAKKTAKKRSGAKRKTGKARKAK
jgi:predicted enzyme related to lactoylglutathione lyase